MRELRERCLEWLVSRSAQIVGGVSIRVEGSERSRMADPHHVDALLEFVAAEVARETERCRERAINCVPADDSPGISFRELRARLDKAIRAAAREE